MMAWFPVLGWQPICDVCAEQVDDTQLPPDTVVE